MLLFIFWRFLVQLGNWKAYWSFGSSKASEVLNSNFFTISCADVFCNCSFFRTFFFSLYSSFHKRKPISVFLHVSVTAAFWNQFLSAGSLLLASHIFCGLSILRLDVLEMQCTIWCIYLYWSCRTMCASQFHCIKMCNTRDFCCYGTWLFLTMSLIYRSETKPLHSEFYYFLCGI